MRRLVALLLFLYIALTSKAQDWNMHWIHAVQADTTSQLWFKRTYSLRARPRRATACVASSGHYILYVNGYNVTTDVLVPYAQHNADTIRVVDYDVTPYLRKGDNTVLVWFSPTSGSTKQLSLQLFGISSRDTRFSYCTNESWVYCATHSHTVSPHTEIVDGRFRMGTEPDASNWSPVSKSQTGRSVLLLTNTHEAGAHAIQQYACPIEECDSTNTTRVVLRTGLQLDGWIRVTLQGMQAGDTVMVNDLTYICNGKGDEQACRRFTTGDAGTVVVSGPPYFSRTNIVGIEAIEIVAREQELFYFTPFWSKYF